jgi:hypothetical protein
MLLCDGLQAQRSRLYDGLDRQPGYTGGYNGQTEIMRLPATSDAA